MSGSNWGERSKDINGDETFTVAAVVTVFLTFCLLIAPILSQTKSHRSDAYYDECTNAHNNNPPVEVSPDSSASTEQTSEYQEYSFKICDLAAQQSMAESTDRIDTYTLFMTVFTLVGVFFLFFTMLYTRRTLDEAREATNSAKEHVEIAKTEQRPWIDFNVQSIGVVWQGADPPPHALISCTNVGKSIAINGYIFCKFHDGSTSNVPEVKKNLINAYQNRKLTHGYSWIPNKEATTDQVMIVDRSTLFTPDDTPKETSMISLSVLIGYQELGSSAIFFTFKNFNLFKLDGFDHSLMKINEIVTTYDSIQEDEYRTEYT